MKYFIIPGILACIYGLHHLALWMESRGWIYYIRRKPSSSALAGAVLQVQQIVQPASVRVLEARQDQKKKSANSGDTTTGASGGSANTGL